MKRCILAGCVLLALAGTAQAQADTPEARRTAATALVRVMDELTGPERTMGAMRASMQAPLMQQIRANTQLSAAQQERAVEVLLNAMTQTLTEVVRETLPATYQAMTDIYVERFSLAEIEAVRAFYLSPAGRKSATVLADDMPRLMQPVMQNMQSEIPRLQQRMEQARRQLEQEGIVLLRN